ncbi:hypothetical protein ACTPEF_25180, partial [Clostridioides difficile]
CEYRNSEFPNEMSKIISNISKITEGHTLALFNSKDRQEKTYENNYCYHYLFLIKYLLFIYQSTFHF